MLLLLFIPFASKRKCEFLCFIQFLSQNLYFLFLFILFKLRTVGKIRLRIQMCVVVGALLLLNNMQCLTQRLTVENVIFQHVQNSMNVCDFCYIFQIFIFFFVFGTSNSTPFSLHYIILRYSSKNSEYIQRENCV